jgi:hypothetical protein
MNKSGQINNKIEYLIRRKEELIASFQFAGANSATN